MTTINTQDLTGTALDWAVATSLGYTVSGSADDYGYTQWLTPAGTVLSYPFRPSASGNDAMLLIRDHNIMLGPPTRHVHRNGGPHAGWGPSGCWSATTFHAGWSGRRAFASHENDPLIAAMRCLVAHHCGPVVDVPQELLS